MLALDDSYISPLISYNSPPTLLIEQQYVRAPKGSKAVVYILVQGTYIHIVYTMYQKYTRAAFTPYRCSRWKTCKKK